MKLTVIWGANSKATKYKVGGKVVRGNTRKIVVHGDSVTIYTSLIFHRYQFPECSCGSCARDEHQ